MIKAVFFDLDNTLYDQGQYFASGFACVSHYLSQQYPLSRDDVHARLWALHRSKGSMYRRLFDDLLEEFGIHDRSEVKTIVRLFHLAPVEALSPYEDASEILPRLAEDYILGLVTNGNAAMQQRKIAALDLSGLLPIQIYTNDLGQPKPAPDGFEAALSASGTQAAESMYVGDNPYTDFFGPFELGMPTVRIIRGEFKDKNQCDAPISKQVHDFYELENLLRNFDLSV
jgi:putative hydrolase of the HAD superfamily